MRDLLPAETARWRRAEAAAAEVFARYGYGEIRTPVAERAELFRRQLGESTDVVQKQMFAFADLSGDEICLRPEATVSSVRAVGASGLHRGGVVRVWYGGPMFRRERPQKGRYRQFWQLGAEAMSAGAPDPAIDGEQILMVARLWRELGIADKLQLHINNLGSAAERAAHRKELAAYFLRNESKLEPSAKERIADNPLRILDSKDPQTAAVAAEAPPLADFLGEESRRHLQTLSEILADAGVEFSEDPTLVRGLDYYNLAVFEWTLRGDSRRQNALGGGGRYDGLSQQIGGPPLHGCGFALGLDRLMTLLEEESSAEESATAPDCFLAAAASPAYCARAAESLREGGLSVWQHSGGGNLGRMLKKADAMRAPLAAIVGEDEESAQTVTLKRLSDGFQQKTALASAAAAAAAMKRQETIR